MFINSPEAVNRFKSLVLEVKGYHDKIEKYINIYGKEYHKEVMNIINEFTRKIENINIKDIINNLSSMQDGIKKLVGKYNNDDIM